jgi:hypothetical protein
MLPILLQIPDLRDEPGPRGRRQPIGRFSIFVTDAQLDEAYRAMKFMPNDDMKRNVLHELLESVAEEQGVAFDPAAGMDYGYIPERKGFWFKNEPNGEPLTLELDRLRKLTGTPEEQAAESRPWWQVWKR